MQILRDWHDATIIGASVALGNFDGVHLGHVALLQAAHTARPNAPLGVLSFEPHPRRLFRPEDAPFRLTVSDERSDLLAARGVEVLYEIPFDDAFASLTAAEFLDVVLGGSIRPRHLVCGPDFAFGRRRGGSVPLLADWAERTRTGLTVVPPLMSTQMAGGGPGVGGQISSTHIRRLLQDGYPERAAIELGRPWSLRGVVEHGQSRGRTLGFPTANIPLGDHLEPARGVYAITLASRDGGVVLDNLPGVANIGRRPTVNDGTESRIEAHVFDWDGNLYGRRLDVTLHHFLRPERKFDGLPALQAQIALDAAQARRLLAG